MSERVKTIVENVRNAFGDLASDAGSWIFDDDPHVAAVGPGA